MKYITIMLAIILMLGCAFTSTVLSNQGNEVLLGSWNGKVEIPGGFFNDRI